MSKVRHVVQSLKNQLEQIFTNIEKTEREADFKEIEEEVADEIKRDLGLTCPKSGKPRKGHRVPLPTPQTIISYCIDGMTVLSLFVDDQWQILKNQLYKKHSFRDISEVHGFDTTGVSSDHLIYFYKICSWFMLPGNNPGSWVQSTSTSLNNMDYFRYFIAILYEQGFLLNIPNVEPKPLRMLNVAELKAELRKRMKEKRPTTSVGGLYRAIGRWVQLADYVDLPAEFMPGFGFRDWQGDTLLLKEVIRYEAENITPYQDIQHDNLIRLLQESQTYIQDFSNDILFMNRKFYDERPDFEHNIKKPPLISNGETKDAFEALLNHTFAVDPRSGLPWFSLQTSDFHYGGYKHLKYTQCRTEKGKLIDCCIFPLLLWSAARAAELLHFKVDGLFINGKRLGPAENAVEAFFQSKGPEGKMKPVFELEFLTFKIAKEKDGKLRKIPLAEDAAHAFCILVELLRVYRIDSENPYLLPTGVLRPDTRGINPQGPANEGFLSYRLERLCNAVGVEYQHPHRCRKTLATIIINKNPDSLELIQRLLGHSTPSMTLRYLMTIPGIAEPLRNHVIASNKKRVLDLLTAAATRRMSGRAAEKMMAAIPPEKLNAEILPDTVNEYLDVLISDPNFVIIRTPAAWCLRFQSLRPQQLPCLPDINLIDISPEELAPDPRNCRPWLCGYAAHTGRHLRRARENRAASMKLASKPGIRAALADSFSVQGVYWGNTVRHLEQGHDDFQEMVPAAVLYS